MTDIEKIALLRTALEAAKAHLDFCGYGDRWERECAQASNLEQNIEDTLEKTK